MLILIRPFYSTVTVVLSGVQPDYKQVLCRGTDWPVINNSQAVMNVNKHPNIPTVVLQALKTYEK